MNIRWVFLMRAVVITSLLFGVAFVAPETRAAQFIPEWGYVPSFGLPYPPSYSGKVKWTGGPHEWNNLNTNSTFYGWGSGLDFAGKDGNEKFPVVAMADGTVMYVGWGDLGKQVAIKHDGLTTLIYGHLDHYITGIQEGVHVKKGQQIAVAGSTGTDNIHLHIELRNRETLCVVDCVGPFPIGNSFGIPMDWDGLQVGEYTIKEYKTAEGKIYNYDGSAIRGSIMIQHSNFPFSDYDSYLRKIAIAWHGNGFSCDPQADTCEDNDISPDTQFSTGGNVGGAGALLVSSNIPPQGGVDTITLFEHPDYQGNQYGWHDTGSFNVPDYMDDIATSLKVTSGWSVRLFENANQTGGSVCKTGDDSIFVGDILDNGVQLDDRISSVQVFNNSNCDGSSSSGADTVAIFEHPGCTGTQYGWHDPTSGWFNAPDYLEDKASCTVVDPGWSVLVSQNANGDGGKRCITETNQDLRYATYDNGININDTISALYIYHDSTCNGQASTGVEPGDTVTIWENFNFAGNLKYGWHDIGLFNVPSDQRDKVSSIGVMPGWSAEVYENLDGTGGARCVTASIAEVNSVFSNGQEMNDSIRSIRLHHDNECGGNRWLAELHPFVEEGNATPIVVSSYTGTSVPGTLYAGQPVYVDYAVENIGTSQASPYFSTSLWLDDQMVQESHHWLVEIGQRVQVVDRQLDVSEPGWHTLKLVIDRLNIIDELDETNNVWEGQFYWEPATGCDTVTLPGTILYSGANCTGSNEQFNTTGIANLANNDAILSVHVPYGNSVKVYKDTNASGENRCLGWDYWDLNYDTWPDGSGMAWTVSSVQMFNNWDCTPPTRTESSCGDIGLDGVVLFANASCNSNYLQFLNAGTYNLMDMSFGWTASSVHVPQGMSVKLRNYEGQERCIQWDFWDFAYDTWPDSSSMNDDATSVTVYENGDCQP